MSPSARWASVLATSTQPTGRDGEPGDDRTVNSAEDPAVGEALGEAGEAGGVVALGEVGRVVALGDPAPAPMPDLAPHAAAATANETATDAIAAIDRRHVGGIATDDCHTSAREWAHPRGYHDQSSTETLLRTDRSPVHQAGSIGRW
jgi:hypothetical protein